MLSALAILALARYATAQDNWWGDYEALSDKMIPYEFVALRTKVDART